MNQQVSKKILITGAHGFLGKHVVTLFEKTISNQLLTPIKGELDLLDINNVKNYLFSSRPDIVIHLAAKCGGIGANAKRPAEFFYDNLMMSANLINESYNCGVEKFVGIGTICQYPCHAPIPFKEFDLYNGRPEETNIAYSAAKNAIMEMILAYRRQYGFNGIYLLPTNMAGQEDKFSDDSSHVIPALIKRFHNAKLKSLDEVVIWGDGSATREFLYAGDCAKAILLATIYYNQPDPINIGTGQEISIKDLVYKIANLIQYNGRIVWDSTKPNGQPRRCVDTTRAKELLGFKAETTLDEILRRTYNWALENKVLCNE